MFAIGYRLNENIYASLTELEVVNSLYGGDSVGSSAGRVKTKIVLK